jgi:hypothetical protein
MMLRRAAIHSTLFAAAALAVSACVSARMHSETELNIAATTCGFALGQLAQDEEEKRLLFIMQDSVPPAQRACVHKWAKRNGLKTVFIQGVEFTQ